MAKKSRSPRTRMTPKDREGLCGGNGEVIRIAVSARRTTTRVGVARLGLEQKEKKRLMRSIRVNKTRPEICRGKLRNITRCRGTKEGGVSGHYGISRRTLGGEKVLGESD